MARQAICDVREMDTGGIVERCAGRPFISLSDKQWLAQMRKIKYIDGRKYQLVEEYGFETGWNLPVSTGVGLIKLSKTGYLRIGVGYAWDGPSGPAWDTKSFMRASLVHDALYEMLRERRLPWEYKKMADSLFREICLEDGMWGPRAWLAWKAVDWFGAWSARPQKKKVLTAP